MHSVFCNFFRMQVSEKLILPFRRPFKAKLIPALRYCEPQESSFWSIYSLPAFIRDFSVVRSIMANPNPGNNPGKTFFFLFFFLKFFGAEINPFNRFSGYERPAHCSLCRSIIWWDFQNIPVKEIRTLKYNYLVLTTKDRILTQISQLIK